MDGIGWRLFLGACAVVAALGFELAYGLRDPGPITTDMWPDLEAAADGDTVSPCEGVRGWKVREIDAKTGAIRETLLTCFVVDGKPVLRGN